MSDTQAVAKLIDKIATLDLEPYAQRELRLLREAMALLPMKEILDLVPGHTIEVKCERIGISRSTWYKWYRGEVRPNRKQAAQIEKLTAIPAVKFAGRR